MESGWWWWWGGGGGGGGGGGWGGGGGVKGAHLRPQVYQLNYYHELST